MCDCPRGLGDIDGGRNHLRAFAASVALLSGLWGQLSDLATPSLISPSLKGTIAGVHASGMARRPQFQLGRSTVKAASGRSSRRMCGR